MEIKKNHSYSKIDNWKVDLIQLNSELMLWKIELTILPDSSAKRKMEIMKEKLNTTEDRSIISISIYFKFHKKGNKQKKMKENQYLKK